MTTSNALAIQAFIGMIEQQCVAHAQPFGLCELLFCIRDIPYGRPASPRDPISVLTDWRGTCSGKHLLAQASLAAMGLHSTLYCLPYRLDDALDTLPREVVSEYAGHGLWDVHNYLEVNAAQGAIKVDVTWSRKLSTFGFPTTLAWDGIEDFRIAAPPGEAISVPNDADLATIKDQLLARLNPPSARALRERYIEALSAFALRLSSEEGQFSGIEATLAEIRQRRASRTE
ncbi:MAG: hypothetical protein JWQ01_4565 [Massilia sp.]|nr:hypothetical protein [Massilia sp.]